MRDIRECPEQNCSFVNVLPHEDEVVRCWWSLSSGSVLPLAHGGICRVLFAGRPGGSAGPDVRDAVLLFQEGKRRRKHIGDVEFHVRSSDWVAHQHCTDPRYNGVILHVVLVCDDAHATMRQDGQRVPVCSLYDLPFPFSVPLLETNGEDAWPCYAVMRQLSDEEREKLFRRAGLLRFEQKISAFVEQLHALLECERYEYDLCLLPALAEALAYGRDRDFFRAASLRLLRQAKQLPEPLGRASLPSPLDAGRLRVLSKLLERVQHVWPPMRQTLSTEADTSATLDALRLFFWKLGLSPARTDIVLCNVIFPFAAAVSLLEHDLFLAQRAQELYEMHPGLSPNRVTRMMCEQLLLAHEPRGSCQQQGLHYIYQQTCRSKRCDVCIMGRKIL